MRVIYKARITNTGKQSSPWLLFRKVAAVFYEFLGDLGFGIQNSRAKVEEVHASRAGPRHFGALAEN